MMGSLGGDQSSAKKKAMWLYPKVLGFNPSERWGHSACYSHGKVYIFGGCCGGLHFSDVLALNLDTMAWNTLATSGEGPGPRDSHSAVLVGRQMIVFGGTNGSKRLNDLHVLDLVTKEWISPECRGNPPSPRESHTATLVGDDKMVIFGGSGEGEANYLNDLHVLDLKAMKWSSPEVKDDIPVPRDSHSAVGIGNKLFVYGGDRGDRYHGDVDVLDMDTLTWTKLGVQGPSPGVRAGHAAVNIGTQVYVIGGVGDKHYYNDTWVLDVVACTWTKFDTCGQQPRGRFSHTAVVAASDIAIYGGCGDDERPLNELLVLQLRAEHPHGLYNISMCKIFGTHWNQEKRRQPRGLENNMIMKLKTVPLGEEGIIRKEVHEPELEPRKPFWLNSDASYPKRKRTTNPKLWDVESEQEEHSLTLSQHSSPSQSDQEQTPIKKVSDSCTPSQGFNLFRQMNQSSRISQLNDGASARKEIRNMVHREPCDGQTCIERQKSEQCLQLVHAGRQRTSLPTIEQKPVERGSINNMMGAEVRGRVDGAFDSGLLMTATVDGRIFRGVLFAPVPEVVSRGPILAANLSPPAPQVANVHPFPISNHMECLKPSQQPSTKPESGQSFRHSHLTRPYPAIRTAQSMAKEPNLRSDLQGVVLTLGGPGTGNIGRL